MVSDVDNPCGGYTGEGSDFHSGDVAVAEAEVGCESDYTGGVSRGIKVLASGGQFLRRRIRLWPGVGVEYGT
jgi:hypothetical protein